MCGIVGLYSSQSFPDRQLLHRTILKMADNLRHRGPDGGDVWQDPEVPIALGHRRLAIIDLSDTGRQPMSSLSARYILTYNGEIYNFKKLRIELERNGISFRGTSDTEVILAAIEMWGINEALANLNGMFAMAIWDRTEKLLYLVRDKLGKKPLYVGWAGGTLVFGSELKALVAHQEFKKEINPLSLTSYMRYGYVPSPQCIYRKVWSLPAGHMMKIDVQNLSSAEDLQAMMMPYWSPLQTLYASKSSGYIASPKPETTREIIKEFESILQTCVQDRMISDVPLGAFLSGGTDSSITVALMQKASKRPIKTYSIGFDEKGYDEAPFARSIAAYLGTEHNELYVNAEQARATIPQLSQIYDEPFADISQIPTFLVAQFARESVTVALSGDGGDEMLGGYNRHIDGPKLWNRMKVVPNFLKEAFSTTITKIPVDTWDFLSRFRPHFGSHMHKMSDVLSIENQFDFYMRLVSHWPDAEKLVIGGANVRIPLTDPNLQPEGLTFSELMMYWDTISYLPGDILTKVDRATMAVGLEARAPLLDQRVYDFVWRLPESMKIHQGQGKWLLRKVLENHIPNRFFERPKQGFSIPIAIWLRGPLKQWAEGLLDKEKLVKQGLLDADMISAAWEEHQKGLGNNAGKLWTVLMFQDWYERWMQTSRR